MNQKSNKAKVLFFSGGSYVFGKEKAMLNIMQGIHDQGIPMHCVINGFNNGQWPQMLSSYKIPFTAIKLGKLTKSLRLIHLRWTFVALFHLPRAIFRIHKILRKSKPKVLFFDSHIPLAIIATFLDLRGYRIIIRHGELPGSDLLYKHLKRSKLFKQITHIANTDFGGKHLAKLGIPVSRIEVIYNGFRFKRLELTERNEEPFHVGCIGQISTWKGQEDLLVALSLVKNNGVDFICSIAGTGKQEFVAFLKEKAKTLGVDHMINWLGYIQDTHAFYKSIDILVVPSRFEEPFGNVAAEAANYGIPAIVTKKGGLPEIVENGVSGLLVEGSNPSQIADSIERLATNKSLTKKMGKRAFKYVTEKYHYGKMVRNYVALLEREAQKENAD